MPGQDPSGRVVTRCGHPANLPPNSSSAQATGLLQALARQQRSCCCPSARPAVQDMRQATTENHSPGYVRCQQGSFPPFFLTVLRRMACNSGVVLSPDWADAFHVAHFSCTKGTSAFSNAVDSLLTTCCVRLEPGECLPLRRLPASPLQLQKGVPKWRLQLQEGRAGMLRSVRVCVFSAFNCCCNNKKRKNRTTAASSTGAAMWGH